jgi:DNA (cytosine-5)-methyltransferase 1
MTDTKLERRREAARRGMERLRRSRGVPPRPVLGKPWEAEGVSKRTWFRRRAAVAAAPAVIHRRGAAYYSDNDPTCVAILRALIKAGVIAPGEVDDRSIEMVHPDDLKDFTQCHFFAGSGAWSIAARMAGYPDDRELWTGSPPCQPFSAAGRGRGVDDPRHLWPDFHRLIRARRPPVVMGEQVAGAAGFAWLDGIAHDLRGDGYAVRGIDLAAAAVDAPHVRQRLYWIAAAEALAHAQALIRRAPAQGHFADWRARADGPQPTGAGELLPELRGSALPQSFWREAELRFGSGECRRLKPGISLLAHGARGRLALNRVIGNGIVVPLAVEVIRAWLETAPES